MPNLHNIFRRRRLHIEWSKAIKPQLAALNKDYEQSQLTILTELQKKLLNQLRDLYLSQKSNARKSEFKNLSYQGFRNWEQENLTNINKHIKPQIDTLKNLIQIIGRDIQIATTIIANPNSDTKFTSCLDAWSKTDRTWATKIENAQVVKSGEQEHETIEETTAITKKSKHTLDTRIETTLNTLKQELADADLSNKEYAKTKKAIKDAEAENSCNRKTSKRKLWYLTKSDSIAQLEETLETLSTVNEINNYTLWTTRWKSKLSKFAYRLLPSSMQATRQSWAAAPKTELNIIKKELAELKNLKGRFEAPIVDGTIATPEKLTTTYQALCYHRKINKLEKRLNRFNKKVQKSNADDGIKTRLSQQIFNAAKTTKHWLDPYYKYGFSKWDVVRLITKTLFVATAAVLTVTTVACLFFPGGQFISLAAFLGLLGFIGLEPLIDSYLAAALNKIIFGRNPTRQHAVEITLGITALPLIILYSFGLPIALAATHISKHFIAALRFTDAKALNSTFAFLNSGFTGANGKMAVNVNAQVKALKTEPQPASPQGHDNSSKSSRLKPNWRLYNSNTAESFAKSQSDAVIARSRYKKVDATSGFQFYKPINALSATEQSAETQPSTSSSEQQPAKHKIKVKPAHFTEITNFRLGYFAERKLRKVMKQGQAYDNFLDAQNELITQTAKPQSVKTIKQQLETIQQRANTLKGVLERNDQHETALFKYNYSRLGKILESIQADIGMLDNILQKDYMAAQQEQQHIRIVRCA